MWKIEWDSKALKEAQKLDKNACKKIVKYLENRVLVSQDPYQFRKPLKGVINQEFGVIELVTIEFSVK